MNHLIGKKVRIPGASDIKVKHLKEETVKERVHSDGSVSPKHTRVLISENGTGYYYYNSKCKIIEEQE